ncbi:MAG TPA: response regulator [Thermoanaerobaculia bacterium]|nr:response regulator [Thermoanaerobaculia bacterium]
MLQHCKVSEPAVGPPVTRPLRVLIVEDERKSRELICREVEELGAEVLVATTAYDAIRIVAEERPDTVVVDGLLPQMHGFELARYIRHMDREYRPRIVVVTGIYRHLRYRNEAKLKYGVDAYLLKPVTKHDLAEVLS